MLNKFRKSNEKGFTLIELLIVVAIIGILAAIAIPQFSAYRQRAYNSASLSDLRNAKTAQESLYADVMCYGVTDGATTLLTAAPAAAGVINLGPMSAAIGGGAPVAGCRIAGTNASNASGSFAFGISNGVNLIAVASTTANPAAVGGNFYDSYVVMARHEQGDTAYGADSDNTTTLYRVSNSQWSGVLNLLSATPPPLTLGADDFAGGVAGGGAPTANWTLM